jgi:translation initiation factor 2 beta subunit (eIF-2beta)/eIF-5
MENMEDIDSEIDSDILSMMADLKAKKRKPVKIDIKENIFTKDDYLLLLKGFYKNNSCTKTIARITPPKITRYGTKKIMWSNFIENCQTINRDHTQIIDYVLNELMVEGSLDINKNFIIKGIFRPEQMLNLFKKFINTYVKCNLCKSIDTCTNKIDRLLNLSCNICKGTRHIEFIRRKH